MTQLTNLELRHSMRHCSTDLARSLSADMDGELDVGAGSCTAPNGAI